MVLFTKWALNKTYGIVDKGKIDYHKLNQSVNLKCLSYGKYATKNSKEKKIIHRF